MWLFFKSTHLVHPCTPHHGGTPLENSGTLWGVRHTRLTSTTLRDRWKNLRTAFVSQSDLKNTGLRAGTIHKKLQ